MRRSFRSVELWIGIVVGLGETKIYMPSVTWKQWQSERMVRLNAPNGGDRAPFFRNGQWSRLRNWTCWCRMRFLIYRMEVFQQDRAPRHWQDDMWSLQSHRDVWVGRGQPIACLPRSLDLTPVDSFLWGYVKNLVFYVKNTYIQHSKVRVRDAVNTITHYML
jgi:hypothetical protein